MSSSTKKGGAAGESQKSEKNDSISSSSKHLKGDSLTTTPSKSSKQGVTKKSASSGAKGNDSNSSPATLNHQALESLYSVTYVEDFIDCNDNMGNDLVRQTTKMFEMGANYMSYVRELEAAMAILLGEDEDGITDQLSSERKKAVFRIQQVLMTAQDTGDDSLQVMQGIQDHIESKTRQLDVDRKNLAEFCKEQDLQESIFKDPPPPPTERNIKRARRVRHEIYRPSILGPSSLKATSYPETVSNNCRDQDTHVVTPSRSRERDRSDRDRESQNQSTTNSTSSSSAGASVSSSTTEPPPSKDPKDNEEQQPPQHKTNGRTSERNVGTSRNSTTSSSTDHNTSSTEKSSSGNSSSAYGSTSSSKKPAQKTQAQAQQQEKRTKKRKAKQSSSNSKDDSSPQQYPIDPDEPTYCLCDQVSYGEMIGCDNDLCPIEWFHFSCVSLTTKPKGKWYCPKCRGDRPNVMKPKAIFLKELEKYNREKEEKA